MNPNIEILRVCLGLDWVNYRTAASLAEKRRRRKQARETIALLRRLALTPAPLPQAGEGRKEV